MCSTQKVNHVCVRCGECRLLTFSSASFTFNSVLLHPLSIKSRGYATGLLRNITSAWMRSLAALLFALMAYQSQKTFGSMKARSHDRISIIQIVSSDYSILNKLGRCSILFLKRKISLYCFYHRLQRLVLLVAFFYLFYEKF